MTAETKLPYRPCVGVMLINRDGLVFVGKRSDVPLAPEGTGQPRSDVFSLGKVLYECVTGMDRTCFPDVPNDWCSGAETSNGLRMTKPGFA